MLNEQPTATEQLTATEQPAAVIHPTCECPNHKRMWRISAVLIAAAVGYVLLKLYPIPGFTELFVDV